MDPEQAYALRVAEDRAVRFVRLWFVDVVGLLKSVTIPISELESALEDGVGMDGSALEGLARGAERDVIARPDGRTFQVLPWHKTTHEARMLCAVRTPSGESFAADSRAALCRVLDEAAELGWTLQVGCEIEFYLFASGTPEGGTPPTPLDDGAYLDLPAQEIGSDFRRRTIEYLEQMGVPVSASHHEVGPSQQEIHLKHMDALSMSDAIVTFRVAARAVAAEMGVHVTFMPKPLEDVSGSGMHVHLSLHDAQHNLFFDPDVTEPLARIGRQFLAGVLAHAREIAGVSNGGVNSYKRLATGMEAPSTIGWTRYGQRALVRVPSGRPGNEGSARIEVRSPDPAANPYLLFALLLSAGLRGIERDYELPPEDPAGVVAPERAEPSRLLPRDLHEATEILNRSDMVRETLGDRLVEWYVANKTTEWEAYRRTVTEFERQRYLSAP